MVTWCSCPKPENRELGLWALEIYACQVYCTTRVAKEVDLILPLPNPRFL